MLQVNNIDVAYGDAQVLFGVSLDIQEGELVAVIGANGAGKTTLLKTISGILRPKNGKIEFLDNVISSQASNRIVSEGIIQIPEGRLLFPKMTVRENLMMGAYLSRGKETIEQRLDMVFDMFAILKDRESQLAGTLSGGEQQMLAIGRGLMAGPKLLMLDEPTLHLDISFQVEIFRLLRRLNREGGLTVFTILHDLNLASAYCDRLIYLKEGRIWKDGPAEELICPEYVSELFQTRVEVLPHPDSGRPLIFPEM